MDLRLYSCSTAAQLCGSSVDSIKVITLSCCKRLTLGPEESKYTAVYDSAFSMWALSLPDFLRLNCSCSLEKKKKKRLSARQVRSSKEGLLFLLPNHNALALESTLLTSQFGSLNNNFLTGLFSASLVISVRSQAGDQAKLHPLDLV